MSKWTQFMDMHSGGGQKLDWSHIYIEAPQQEAESVFYAKLGRNPHRVTCTCCGPDYSLSESESLEEATGYERGCAYVYRNADGAEIPQSEAWVRGKGQLPGVTAKYEERASDDSYRKYTPLDAYLATVKVIRASEISDDERRVSLPAEGYVWA